MNSSSDSGPRFAFGKNWAAYIHLINESRIDLAQQSVKNLCGQETLQGKTFLDIGSGSGLSSLAAIRLGATVTSFDYDLDSVASTDAVKQKFAPDAVNWTVRQGSVLDEAFLKDLGTYDVVYSWGVLHHTGQMYLAFENVVKLVKEGGKLIIAIYNDQGWLSRFWKVVKQKYVTCAAWRLAILAVFIPVFFFSALGSDLIHARNPTKRYRSARDRGMSPFYDWIDWLGGYPFEVASREDVVTFFTKRNFTLLTTISAGAKLGCNQFSFKKGS